MKIKKITIENALSFGEGDDKLDIHSNGQITSIRSQEIYLAEKTQTLSAQSGLSVGMEGRKDVNRLWDMAKAFPCFRNMSIFSHFLDTSQRYVHGMDISASGNILPENRRKGSCREVIE